MAAVPNPLKANVALTAPLAVTAAQIANAWASPAGFARAFLPIWTPPACTILGVYYRTTAEWTGTPGTVGFVVAAPDATYESYGDGTELGEGPVIQNPVATPNGSGPLLQLALTAPSPVGWSPVKVGAGDKVFLLAYSDSGAPPTAGALEAAFLVAA